MTWLPEWRISVGDDVYTTVTAASFSTGRLNIDAQCTAGYSRVEIVNVTNAPFTIDITDRLQMELKNKAETINSLISQNFTELGELKMKHDKIIKTLT